MSIVSKYDFIGEYYVPQTQYDDLDTFIKDYEAMYLLKLLGAELYNLFISDLDANTIQKPQNQIYLDIFDPFNKDESKCIVSSKGIRKMLVMFIYFHYIRETQLTNTATGTTKNRPELAVMASYKNNIIKSFNEANNTAKAIQWFICKNSDIYPNYNGQYFDNLGLL